MPFILPATARIDKTFLFFDPGLMAGPFAHFLDQSPLFDRFRNITGGADTDGHLPMFLARPRRHDENRSRVSLRPRAQGLDDFVTIQLRHFEVRDDQLVGLHHGFAAAFLPVRRRFHRIPGGFEHASHELSDTEGVIDQQERQLGAGRLSRITLTRPFSARRQGGNVCNRQRLMVLARRQPADVQHQHHTPLRIDGGATEYGPLVRLEPAQ